MTRRHRTLIVCWLLAGAALAHASLQPLPCDGCLRAHYWNIAPDTWGTGATADLPEMARLKKRRPVDLGIARCRLMLAGPAGQPRPEGRFRVATKYVNTTRNYYADLGRQVEIIRLYGSMELAPILGLADLIVDLVDTGGTLQANGLVTLDMIADITSRLVVNKASMKMKQGLIKPFIKTLAALVDA